MSKPSLSILPLALATALTAGLATQATRNNMGLRYALLRKPPYQPPSWLFAPVWTVLYGMMTWSAYRVVQRSSGARRRRAMALWGAQLVANGAWSFLFFQQRRRKAALVDLAALWTLIAAYTVEARKTDKVAANLMLPYLGWTTFAGVLNAGLVARNG